MLTLVIPTKNRSFYIRKLLRYYAESGLKYPVFIGDSSDPEEFEKNEVCVKEYGKRIEIAHFFSPHSASLGPGEGTIACMNDLLKKVKAPYAVFNADDDFFVPSTLGKCVDFLETNPGYSAVSGRALLVDIDVSKFPREFVKGVGPYCQISAEADSASNRLNANVLRKNGTLQFAVKRTKDMRTDWQCVKELKLDNYFEELLTISLCSIRGKFKALDCLYMVRRAHKRMISVNTVNSRDAFDWMCGPRFSGQCDALMRQVSLRLAEADGIGIPRANELVKEVLWRHLNSIFSRRWEKLAKQKRALGILKSLIKNMLVLYRPLRKIHSTFLDLQIPHKSEFTPIYKIITGSS